MAGHLAAHDESSKPLEGTALVRRQGLATMRLLALSPVAS